MFSRSARLFPTTRQAYTRILRAGEPEEANRQQRSGPGLYAAAAMIAVVGGVYFFWGTERAATAKHETTAETSLKDPSARQSPGGGGSRI
ncbi:uncharacterized protein BYT42DRAFT_614848 [Radiomyces spectabilis]|uniref:uncharacterized protein n=1 Tax=Radiomyces spectabilis TaxID=64574 RepID=UPI00221FEB04|nr:uncharacterized protein BYT42DRAFT_614848 [Radiomyces spectabilis]KAI8376059.1 hypothetical protein BYT42DRAFT_614848 [Radiomyces spectabilis]